MSDSRSDPNLQFSPAAKAALTEAVQDISNELSWRAATIANRGAEGPTLVSVADVAAALEERPAAERQLRRQLKFLSIVTIVYGIAGLVLAAVQLVINGRSNGPLVVASALMLGVAIPGLTVWTMKFIFADRWLNEPHGNGASPDELYKFVRFWIVIESTIRTIYSGEFGESRASLPLISMLYDMKERGVVDSETFDKLNEMREVRNKVAHGKSGAITRRRLSELTRDGRAILERLSRESGSGHSHASS